MNSPPNLGDKTLSSSRQRPGSACEECRRRKLRCDGKQPQCEVCFESGIPCVVNMPQSRRGPKKGHLKALQTRIETILDVSFNEAHPRVSQSIPDSNSESCSGDRFPEMRTPQPLGMPTNAYIPDLLRADLDQLYFDRVHIFVPILHQRQYFSWAKQATKTESRTCLQFAMWTMAASLSAQLEHIRDSLYRDTQQILESLELKDDNLEFTNIEHAQAWLLLAIYEFMRTNYQRGWMSAGRCFRLVQLMRLYEIDKQENWIKTEEKRRTFWMAYTLDRLINIRHEWPLTLNEQVISTRLPAPEEDFQRGQCIVPMGFLSEVITSSDSKYLSSFAECIILATICGRSLSHRQQSAVEHVYGEVSQHFWDQHQWLDTILTKRVQLISLKYPSASEHIDPMLLFVNMVAQTTILYHCKIMESISWQTDEYQTIIIGSKQRALSAAREIVSLTKILSQLSYFKIHPFTPLPLSLCADFFMTHQDLDESLPLQLQEVLEALRELTTVNNLAQTYCHDL
ncbi:citrinin biosynthesis transcriptional activator CtnR [Glonium stellatum]|uniref:Citrinin biosynthesis transcriptional activator CtnR n=1 Tax=Glonium stellatum TaxID=574774 RepID=A0A8E2JMS1_9PEZI|nr:citrinin biosynthesis transcriptional activator CtnR [Glonium stellatum]